MQPVSNSTYLLCLIISIAINDLNLTTDLRADKRVSILEVSDFYGIENNEDENWEADNYGIMEEIHNGISESDE